MVKFIIEIIKSKAEDFFTRPNKAGVHGIVDVHLQNTSQLKDFIKAVDLSLLLEKIGDISSLHAPELEPDVESFVEHQKNGLKWDAFESVFSSLWPTARLKRGLIWEIWKAPAFCVAKTAHITAISDSLTNILKIAWGVIPQCNLSLESGFASRSLS